MPVELSIGDDEVQYLNPEAQNALTGALKSYSEDILDEAMRLESTSRASSGNPQITSGIIEDSDLILRRGYKKPQKSKLRKAGQLLATGAGVVAGILADQSLLIHPPYLILFIIVASTALTLTLILAWVE
jgi:hypothetical protein